MSHQCSPFSLCPECANGPISTENAARDFFEYVNETETNVGPIQNAVGARNNDRNDPTNRRRRGGRSLVAPSQAPEGSWPRAVAMNEPHQFVLGGQGDPVIVCGPRRANNRKVEGDVVGRVKATIDRSDRKRLLVTFSGLVFKGKGGEEEKQKAQQGDEGKDVHSMYGSPQASEDLTLHSNAEEMEICPLYEETL